MPTEVHPGKVIQTFKLFTVRNSSCGKVMFSQTCVKNSVHRGWEVYTPSLDTHTPTPGHTPFPWTPPRQTSPPDTNPTPDTHTGKATEADGTHPTGMHCCITGTRGKWDTSKFQRKYHYRPQRSWGKVIFPHASVILLTGGLSAPGGVVCSRGVSALGVSALGVSAPGGVWSGGCLLPGGVCSGGDVCSLGDLVWRVSAPGGCVLQGSLLLGAPGGVPPPPGTATAAVCTHPTGMHSC